MQNSKLTDEWYNEEADDFGVIPENFPKILSYNILVKPMAVNAKTRSGIIIPQQTQDSLSHLMSVGLVVAMGDECFTMVDNRGHIALDEDGKMKRKPESFKVGDWIVWPRHAGTNFEFQNKKYKILTDDQPLMVLNDPNDVSVNYGFAQ